MALPIAALIGGAVKGVGAIVKGVKNAKLKKQGLPPIKGKKGKGLLGGLFKSKKKKQQEQQEQEQEQEKEQGLKKSSNFLQKEEPPEPLPTRQAQPIAQQVPDYVPRNGLVEAVMPTPPSQGFDMNGFMDKIKPFAIIGGLSMLAVMVFSVVMNALSRRG